MDAAKDAPEIAQPGAATMARALDAMAAAFIALDPAWSIVEVNRSAERQLRAIADASLPSLLGQNLWAALPATVGTELELRLREAAAARGASEFVVQAPVSRRWLSFRTSASDDGLVVLFHDETTRRRAFDALRVSEERMRWLFEEAPEGILLTAPTGEIFAANPAACRMLGRSEREICHLGRSALVDEGDPRLAILLARREASGFAAGDLTMRHADGSRFPVAIQSSLFVDEYGARRTSLSFHDLSARQRVEEERAEALAALRDAEEMLRLTIDHAPIGMAILELDGRFRQVNQRLCEIVGYDAAELTTLRYQDVTHPEDRGKDAPLTSALLRGEIPRFDLPKRYVGKSGNVVDVLLHVSLLRNRHDGSPRNFIAQTEDMTDRRRLEAQIALSDRMASVGTLASGIAHEINNPLTYVMTNLELVERALGEEARADLRPLVSDARAGAERVRDIVRGLRAFGRADAEAPRPLDVHSVLDVALGMSRNALGHVARVVKDYGTAAFVLADEPRLVQVFINLLVNAAEAIPEGHAAENEIRLRTRAEAGYASVEVHDSGSGIPEALLARIFDPFFTTKGIGSGVGLGLSISHAIVASLGGTLRVSSEVARGSVFCVSLPLCAREAALPPPAKDEPTAAPSPRARVLVVDDEASLCAVMKRMLEPDFPTTTATSGVEALSRIRGGERFAVIVSDVMMPELSGPDLYREILTIDAEQARRVAFMSGGAFTPKARAFLDGVDNPRLEKPFDVATLRTLVSTIARGS